MNYRKSRRIVQKNLLINTVFQSVAEQDGINKKGCLKMIQTAFQVVNLSIPDYIIATAPALAITFPMMETTHPPRYRMITRVLLSGWYFANT